MQTSNLHYGSIAPDLLKRFIPTPFQGTIRVHQANVRVKSNDITVIATMKDLFRPAPARISLAPHSFLWKLVYDKDAPSDLRGLTVIACGPTRAASFGPACLVGVDHERNELIGFLGVAGNDCAFRQIIVPVLTDLTIEALAAEPSGDQKIAKVGAMGDRYA